MEVVFEWNVNQDLVIKTIKLKGELDQGEHHGIIKNCFQIQRELERKIAGRESFECSVILNEKEFHKYKIKSIGSLQEKKQKKQELYFYSRRREADAGRNYQVSLCC